MRAKNVNETSVSTMSRQWQVCAKKGHKEDMAGETEQREVRQPALLLQSETIYPEYANEEQL